MKKMFLITLFCLGMMETQAASERTMRIAREATKIFQKDVPVLYPILCGCLSVELGSLAWLSLVCGNYSCVYPMLGTACIASFTAIKSLEEYQTARIKADAYTQAALIELQEELHRERGSQNTRQSTLEVIQEETRDQRA